MAKMIVGKDGADIHIHWSRKEILENGVPIINSEEIKKILDYGNEIDAFNQAFIDKRQNDNAFRNWGEKRKLTKEEMNEIGKGKSNSDD